MNKIKYCIGIICFGLLASCGKENVFSNDFGTVQFVNASSSTPTGGINVFVDTMRQTASGLAYRGTSGYLSVRPGDRNIQLKSNNTASTQFFQSTESFPTNQAYTYFIYDTLATGSNNLKVLRLRDTLTVPPIGSLRVRFVNLALNSGPVDITFLRTGVTPADSVTVSSVNYVGANPTTSDLSMLSGFRTIPLGAYTVKIKNAGTQTVRASANFSLSQLSGTGNQTGIVTIYAAGTTQGQPLTLNLIRHYP